MRKRLVRELLRKKVNGNCISKLMYIDEEKRRGKERG